jgi:hypothetical protein
MREHIVVVLRKSAGNTAPHARLTGLPTSAVLEPLFTLPPRQAGEHETVADMRRVMRVTVLEPGIDAEELARHLMADPLVETAYLERRVEPA